MHWMIRTAAVLPFALSAVTTVPSAQAEDSVTYEVVSNDIGLVDIEYTDEQGRKALQGVALPWRADVDLADVHAPPPHGAEVRVDWRAIAGPSRWLTVRIHHAGKIICQSTLDIGNATCYGITPYGT